MIARAAALLLAAAALPLAGCAGAAPAATATPQLSDGPLQQLLAEVDGTDDEVAYEQRMRQVEYLTAACMADRGFEYTPDDPAPVIAPDEFHPDDPSWVARWGYGIVEHPDGDGRQTLYEPSANALYAASLSGAQFGGYYAALYGTGGALGTGINTDPRALGCHGAADLEVNGEDVTRREEFEPVVRAIAEFQTSTASDPGIVALEAAWSDCMAGAGYEGLARQSDARQTIDAAVAAIDMRDAERVDAVHAQEVEIALADLGCRREVDYGDRYAAVRFGAEQRFVDDHRIGLDALVAAARSARARAAG